MANADGLSAGVAVAETLSDHIDQLLDEAGVRKQRRLITQLVETSIGLGTDGTSRENLKLTEAAIAEMRRAFQLFSGHEQSRKVTIFGSARTRVDDPLWAHAEESAAALAARGWMVVTGAGPGIMEAAVRGAGVENSIGVSIRLPFEEEPTDMLSHDANHVAMRYFFTRKLMLVKESSGFICLPGGFGTLDETLELLTLQQTGKMQPAPIVLLESPGGTYWSGFATFVQEELAGAGLISADDLARVLITDSVEEAVAEIEGFWRNFDSLRWTPDRSATGPEEAVVPAIPPRYDRLVLRLKHVPTSEEVEDLNARFSHVLQEGTIEITGPLAPELGDKERLELPRLTLVPARRSIGSLHHLIRAINELPSARHTRD